MSKVKKQHYVPQFYLKGFANSKGRLFALKCNTNKTIGEIFETKPYGVCAENYLYEVQGPSVSDGRRYVEEGAVEKGLSHIESEISLATRNC